MFSFQVCPDFCTILYINVQTEIMEIKHQMCMWNKFKKCMFVIQIGVQ
jgi:hypothetical protein